MYEQFFGLKELPFSLTPDPGFVYCHAGHQEALNDLLSGLQAGEGFLSVMAEVGTGKTLLCRKLLSLLPENWASAYLPNPLLTPLELYRSIARELGASTRESLSLEALQQGIFDVLIAVRQQNGQTVILIDEAQAMSRSSLEALRLLSNLETEKEKLLQVVFFAQPEFETRLRKHALRQLRQRITFVCRLRPIPQNEIAGYLNHRLARAGYNGPSPFTAAAVRSLYRKSGGCPRIVNILAHKSLLAAYGKGGARVTSRQVGTAVTDTFSVDTDGVCAGNATRFWLGFASSLILTLTLIYLLRGAA